MRRTILTALAVTVILPAIARAQERTAAQMEVWNTIEAHWAIDKEKDLEGFLGYLHPDFLGWSNRAALPSDRASTEKWTRFRFSAEATVIYEIKPVGIKVHGDVAFAHYYAQFVNRDADSEQETIHERWTDSLLKSGDRWLFIGWPGGSN